MKTNKKTVIKYVIVAKVVVKQGSLEMKYHGCSVGLRYEAINLCQSFQEILRKNILNIYENQQRHGHKLRDQKLL